MAGAEREPESGPALQPRRHVRNLPRSAREQLELALAAQAAGGGGKKPSPKDASRSETNSPNTPAGAASVVASAYSDPAGSGAGTIGRSGSLNSSAGAGLGSETNSSRPRTLACGIRDLGSGADGTSSVSSTETSSTASGCFEPTCASAASISCHTAANWAAPGFSFSSLAKTTRACSAIECAR